MSSEFELHARARTDKGTAPNRRLRREADEIPAIIYGGNKEAMPIALSHKEISWAVEFEAFFSHILTIHIDGKKEQAVIKDLQRHPSRPFILHADFQRVSAKQALHVRVPVHFLNEEKCKGVKMGGGSVIKNLTELEVECLPKDLPEYLEIDLVDMDVGDTLHISDISLPRNVTSVNLAHGADADDAVVTVKPPRGGSVETGEDEEETGSEADGPDEQSGSKSDE